MYRHKYLIISISVVVVIVATSAVGWFVIKSKNSDAITTQTSDTSSGRNSIPLSEFKNQNDSPGGLSVDSNSQAASLGQIQLNDQTGNTSPSETKKSSDPFDPTTFLQYERYKNANGGLFADVQKGTGDELLNGKKAVVLYKGWLTDGQVFDQSKTGTDGKLQAFSFTQGAHEVIPGWEQAMSGMKAGGVRLVIVPPAFGYGEAGQGLIPGNAVLIFQVQLIDVQ